jgi:ribosomal protein S18 acetylase RimI-like enzyme
MARMTERHARDYEITVPVEEDGTTILEITASTAVFEPEEIETVAELWGEFLSQGAEASGYYFIVYRKEGKVLGYACYGPRALTQGTYDLYWIAVSKSAQGLGVGKVLIRHVEKAIAEMGGRLIIVETSGLEKYHPTRRFYDSAGYEQEAVLRDFYRPGDDLVVFTKHL